MNHHPLSTRAGRSTLAAIALVGILGWTGCGSDSQPITSATSKYEVADAPAPAGNASAASSGTSASAENTQSGLTDGTSQAAVGAADSGSGEVAQAAANEGAPVKPSANPPGSPPAEPETPDVQKLLEHLAELQGRDPRAATREETINNLVSTHRDVVQTADKILKSEARESSLVRAAESKIQSLTFLSQVQREAGPQLKAFIAELQKSPHAKLAMLARHMDFAQQMQAFANGESADVAKLLANFKQVFQEQQKDAALLTLSQQVSEIFSQTNHSKEAVEVMKMVVDAYQDHADKNLVSAAKMVNEQLAFVEVGLEEKVMAVLQEKPNSDKEFLAAMDLLLKDRELSEMTMQFLGQMTHLIETRNLDLAEAMFAKMGAAFEKQSTPEIAKKVQEMAANFAKRKAIIGKPFTVDGVTLDGKEFDWGQYQGKVVLVDFWATWCRPCLEEIPNIKQNYDQYHEQGFEVVGVNIDDDPEMVHRFFSRQKLPWATVRNPDTTKQGFEHPLLAKCGVEGIPFLVLVGRDGKALALNPRGEELGKKLATLLDSAPAAGSPAPAAANPLREGEPKKKAESKEG